MTIGIDSNEANVKTRVGVGRYAYELLKQFSNYQLPTTNYQIYLKDKPKPDLPKETDWWQYKVVGPRKLWTQIGLPLALYNDCLLRGRRVDVFFTPTHYAPRFCPCPRVISIMDLSFLKYPKMFKAKDLCQLKNWTAYSVAKAKKILTISKSTKDDIIKYYQVPEEKVVVTYPGSNHEVLNMKNIREKYGIKGEYFLSVGTLQPRKNFVRLIEAFSTLDPNPISPKGASSAYTLVIVGKKGWLYEEILAAPKKFGVKDRVKFLDYVPDDDLPALYKDAKCFVLVSLYEGFGLPALEAMNYGCPVVVSNVSSLPEVAGEAGILVNPNNVEEIVQAITKVLNMDEKEKREMVEKGFKQASKFSWEKCAKETLKVLEEVGGKRV